MSTPICHPSPNLAGTNTNFKAATNNASFPPTLLSLPGEVRNRIYGYSLVEASRITIDDQDSFPAEPALLQTCRRVRSEALDIYYKENEFRFIIEEFEASHYIEWCQISDNKRLAYRTFVILPSTNWIKLKMWMKSYYHGECGAPVISLDTSQCNEDVVVHMSSLVRRAVTDGISWESVDFMLECVHKSLAATNTEWA